MTLPQHWMRNLPEAGTMTEHADKLEHLWSEIAKAMKDLAGLRSAAYRREQEMMLDAQANWTEDEITEAMTVGASQDYLKTMHVLGVLFDYENFPRT